ncbi:MAG TPA: hypothetical protein VN893_24230, partial [Bryobacteraceae bacterium]|nr:hypothetical protein [Bryobacteraceae bacterium]
MSSGSPLLLSGNQAKLLSRVSMKADCDAKYRESFLQGVIDRSPNVLPIRDFYRNADGLWSLGREVPVDLGEAEGKIDNLLVTNDGHLVIVETKLWRNPESVREVISQTLQYGMAVSQLPSDEFEERLRRSAATGRRLGKKETVLEFLKNATQADSLQWLDDDFEDNFERWRRDGEILFLIVADGIHLSVERLVHWMNGTVGSRPYQLGLVELGLY